MEIRREKNTKKNGNQKYESEKANQVNNDLKLNVGEQKDDIKLLK